MRLRACLVAIAAALCLAAESHADPPAPAPGARGEREKSASLAGHPPSWKLRIGVPETPFEAERDLFGFHLRFDFGRDAARDGGARRGRTIR